MQRVAALVSVVVALTFGLAPVGHSAEQVKGYIYDGTGRANNLSIVIDVATRDVEIQGTARAHQYLT
ncbi:hypothetical protein GCM10009121_25970 [Rhodanobacter soli]